MAHERVLIRITLVEDHALFAEALDVVLTLEGHDVHRIALDSQALHPSRMAATISGSRPDVVLLDLNLRSSANGVALIQPLTHAGFPVIVVTGSRDLARWGECMINGASTVICKSAPLSTILSTIRLVHEGTWFLPYEERNRLEACFHEDAGQVQDCRARLATLTPRECEILDELMMGHHVREIARDFVVSEATVRTHIKSILAKMRVSSQLAAVGMALRGHRRRPVPRENRAGLASIAPSEAPVIWTDRHLIDPQSSVSGTFGA